MKDYYSILGIPRYASEQTIKEAYRRMAKRWHPDANNGNENAKRIMQDLNRAKEVLFEKDTRDEYRRVLEMQDALSAENIKRFRKKWNEKKFEPSELIPPPKPFARNRFILLMGLVAIAVGVAIFRLSEVSSSKQMTSDPIENIIKRNTATVLFPVQEHDTIVVPNVASDRLEQMGSALAMLGEYKGAAKFWEKYLETDRYNFEVATNLMLAYLHRNEIAKAVQTIKDHVTSDTNLVIIYSTLGDYFRVSQKSMDAEDAYEKVAEVGSKIKNPSSKMKEYIHQAQKRIDKR